MKSNQSYLLSASVQVNRFNKDGVLIVSCEEGRRPVDGFGCNKRSSRAACGAGAKNEAGQSQNSILVWIGMDMNGHTEDG